MYRKYFPKCKIEGDKSPKAFTAMVTSGAIPNKCTTCSSLFEGSCVRDTEENGDYLNFDYESCPVEGSTTPAENEAPNKLIQFVPTKCINCENLKYDDIRQYVCTFESDTWGNFYRGLDWGDWEPEHTPMTINGMVASTDEVTSAIKQGKNSQAIKELRRLYPPLSLNAAIKCIEMFKERLS